MAKVLNVEVLKTAVNAILDHILDDLSIREINIDDATDFYWDVLSDALFKVKEDQPTLAVGRLSDDWEFLEPVVSHRERAVSLMLIHAAPLLRYVGEKIGQ